MVMMVIMPNFFCHWRPNMVQALSLKKNMLWNSLGSLFNLGCQWLTTVLVVRLSTGFDAAGTLSLAMAIANIFQPIALFSMRSYQVSDVNKDVTASEYVGFRLITIAVAFLLCVAYSILTGVADALIAVVLYLVYKAIEVFIDVLHGVDQQHMRMDYCGKSMAMRGVLSLAAFCLGLLVFNSLEAAILSMTVSVLPVCIYDIRVASQLDDVRPSISLRRSIELVRSCLPAVIGTACCSAVISVARQKLGFMEGQDALGLYASVCTPVVVVQSCIRYVYAPLLGEFASKFSRGDYASYTRLFFRVILAFIAFCIIGVIAFRIFGHGFLLYVFGDRVAALSGLLDMAIVSVVLCAFVSFLSDQLIALRRLMGVMIGNIAGLFVSVILSASFIQFFGLNGTSIVIILSYMLASLIMLAYLGVVVKNTSTSRVD